MEEGKKNETRQSWHEFDKNETCKLRKLIATCTVKTTQIFTRTLICLYNQEILKSYSHCQDYRDQVTV